MNAVTPLRPRLRALDDLAIFGGRPLFDSPRPLGQLGTPDVERFLGLLREAYERGQLTGNGAFVQQLEARLAAYHGVQHCIAVANAALGLTMLMQVLAQGRHGEVVMPAFTYPGLPHFSRFAGQTPRFCDVDEATHGLDPRAVQAALSGRTTAILAVNNSNQPPDIDGLTRVAEAAGVPLFFDSVDGVGTTYRGKKLGGFGRAEVFSLHATKLLNGFEGGYITTNDAALAAVLRWQREQAPAAMRPDGAEHVLGMNGTLNEIHAALALLSLDNVGQIVARNQARHDAYMAITRAVGTLRLVPGRASATEQGNWRWAVCEILEGWPLTREHTVALLRAEGAEIAPYYGLPLHRSAHCPPGYDVQPLPVTERLGKRFFHLPVGDLVSLADIERFGELLRFVAAHGPAIAARMATP